jgi:asparagine synthase (glutamine-hydrolysing)
MGYIAALLSKTSDNATPALIKMLDSASNVRGDAYGIASDEGTISTGSHRGFRRFRSDVVLGHKLAKIMPCDLPQPVYQHGYAMAFEGRVWQDGLSNLTTVADLLDADPCPGIRSLIEQVQGSYKFVVVEGDRIICSRDPVGVVPFYVGENETLAGLASNRKMLWAVGIKAKTLPPGHIVEITKLGLSFKPVRRLEQPPIRALTMEEAVHHLDKVMMEAVETRCKGVFRGALGFSGGIDSTLIAHYLDKAGVEVDLICVGMEGSPDFSAAETAVDSLGLPLRLESFTNEDVDETLDDVLWSVEDPDAMKVGVALPLYWASRSAAEAGCKVFFSGNGSDELFAGYHRYVQEYAKSGEAMREALFRDVVASHGVNYERDYKVCADAGLELRLPFADLRVTDFGLSLPVGLKLAPDPHSPRKLVLRALAMKLGIPEDVANRRKKAVQYSTGVDRALRRLARMRGKTLRGYLEERFGKVKSERLGDLA